MGRKIRSSRRRIAGRSTVPCERRPDLSLVGQLAADDPPKNGIGKNGSRDLALNQRKASEKKNQDPKSKKEQKGAYGYVELAVGWRVRNKVGQVEEVQGQVKDLAGVVQPVMVVQGQQLAHWPLLHLPVSRLGIPTVGS